MEIRFEYINPINFLPAIVENNKIIVDNIDIIDVDNKNNEYSKPFVQYFDVTDRLQFAFYFHSSIKSLKNVKIDFIDNDEAIIETNAISLTNDIDGDFYSFYCSQNRNGREWSGGVVYSKLFKDIFSNTTDSQYCKKFKLLIELTFGNFETHLFLSNEINIQNNAIGKLLEYNPSGEYDYRLATLRSMEMFTFYPYAIRIDSSFLQPQFKTEREVFVNYDMYPITTNAKSYESVVLSIGGVNGYPDWVYRKLNNIFSVSKKWIDGKEFEITSDGDLSVEIVQGYNNRYGTVGISIKKEILESFIVTDIVPNITTITLQQKDTLMVGSTDLIGLGDWNIVDQEDGTLLKVNPNKRQGSGKDTIEFVHGLNLTGSNLIYTIIFKTENIQQNIIIIVPPIRAGIGFGAIGETFYIG